MERIVRVRQLKEALNNVPDNMYIAVGTHEQNDMAEIKNESGIISVETKPIGFADSNEKYCKIYINQYTESGCMRFVR